MTDLHAFVAEVQELAPLLREFDPSNEDWVNAEKRGLELRDEFESLLKSPGGVQKLRDFDALPALKQLVPEEARGDISKLKVSDFILGIMYLKPYLILEETYRGFGYEYAKELSKEARKELNNVNSSYVYGEIEFFQFASVIRYIAPSLPEHAIFYDIGSGTGKAVIAASLVHRFDQAKGIEILQPLVNCAEKRKAALLRNHSPFYTDMDFIADSFFTVPWNDGDVVFCHGTCFSDSEWAQISKAAESLKQGAWFISTSQVLQTGLFEVVQTFPFIMSWGTATLYIQRRRKIGKWAAQMLRGVATSSSTRTTKEDEKRT